MTQVVRERERYSEFVGTHVDAATRARLFEHALEEMTSASAVLRRALRAELRRLERVGGVAEDLTVPGGTPDSLEEDAA
jgi:hypothetical protein